MPAELSRRAARHPAAAPAPDPAFAARPRLVRLRDALARAAEQLRPARWNEPAVFFFCPTRQAELEAARPAPADRFAALAALIAAELPALLEYVEVRRVARTLDGLKPAARALAPHCPAATDLAELLAVPDDEVFLALAPADRTGVRLHVRGAARVAQLCELLGEEPLPPAPSPKKGGGERTPLAGASRSPTGNSPLTPPPFLGEGAGGRGSSPQLFAPAALLADGTLPRGFAGCGHWLWPEQPLAAVPRVNGERVVLVGSGVVRAAVSAELRFPELRVEAEVVQTLSPFQVADELSRLAGRRLPVAAPADPRPVARAA